jgi:hypothetical protein
MFVVVVATVLLDHVPGGPESLLWGVQCYILGVLFVLTAAFGMDLLMTFPVCLLGFEMIDCSNWPLMSMPQREFWRRHNTNVVIISNPFCLTQLGTLFSIFLVFSFNTLLHVLWYHPMYFNGLLEWHYIPLLMLPPVVMEFEPKNPLVQFLILQIGDLLFWDFVWTWRRGSNFETDLLDNDRKKISKNIFLFNSSKHCYDNK